MILAQLNRVDPITSPSPPDGGNAGPALLVVDDEPFLRIAVRRWFERAGWHVVEASDGDIALALLTDPATRRPDVVVADRRMPRLDGLALHAALLARDPALAARFVLASGDPGEPALVAFARDTGCPVVGKPFQLPVLAELAARIAGNVPPPGSASP